MTNITKEMCQERALGTYLSYWDEDLAYQEILDRLRSPESFSDEKEIDACELYEGMWDEQLADLIEAEYESLCRFVGIAERTKQETEDYDAKLNKLYDVFSNMEKKELISIIMHIIPDNKMGYYLNEEQ